MKITKTKIKQHLRMPIGVLIKLIFKTFFKRLSDKSKLKKDFSTDERKTNFNLQFHSLIDISLLDFSSYPKLAAEVLSSNYLNKVFDLLGSGPVKNTRQKSEQDAEGQFIDDLILNAHSKKSKELWQEILRINPNYQSILWQREFKANKSYSAKVWYKNQRKLGEAIGIDIKVPWELSRLQHLPQMALFCIVLPSKKVELVKEFKAQVLDFIMMNPFNMGANWNCAMDVGIRAANLLVAFDWFKQIDSDACSGKFEEEIKNYVFLHAKHLIKNFEYKEGLTSNHYLGNIVGLCFISSYLSGNQELEDYLLLSIQELANELAKQFLPDGSNFEGSTSYHRLSGEFFILAVSLLNKVPKERIAALNKIKSIKGIVGPQFNSNAKNYNLDSDLLFSNLFYETLGKMKYFTLAYTKPNDQITQIGDNDSGRFFKFTPTGKIIKYKDALKRYKNLSKTDILKLEDNYFDENDINHNAFIAMVDGMFQNTTKRKNDFSIEFSIVTNLIGRKQLVNSVNTKSEEISVKENLNLDYQKNKTWSFPNNDLLEELDFECFIDFGMIVFRSKHLYLNINLPSLKATNRLDGHKHNDLLSIELLVDGKNYCIDPGTYIYTASPQERNKFRQTRVHNTIFVEGIEQRDFSSEKNQLFFMEGIVNFKILKLNKTEFIGVLKYKQVIHMRKIVIQRNEIQITDMCNHDFEQNFNKHLFSNGYGKLVNPEYV